MNTPTSAMRNLLSTLIEKNSYGMQLRVGRRPLFRVAGDMQESLMPPVVDSLEMKTLLVGLIGAASYARFEAELQTNFLIEFEGCEFSLYLTRSRGQVAASLQRMPNRILTLSQLHLPRISEFLCHGISRGLVLVNGAVGSGWGATVAAMRHEVLSMQESNVMTLGSSLFVNQPSIKGLHTSILVGLGQDVDNYEAGLQQVEQMDTDYLFVMESLCNLPPTAVRRILDLARSRTVVVANVNADSTEAALSRMLWLLEHPDRELAQQQLATALRVCICQQLLRGMDGSSMIVCQEILDVVPELRPAIRNFDLDKISRTLASHSESTSMKRAAKKLLDSGLIGAAEYERV